MHNNILFYTWYHIGLMRQYNYSENISNTWVILDLKVFNIAQVLRQNSIFSLLFSLVLNLW